VCMFVCVCVGGPLVHLPALFPVDDSCIREWVGGWAGGWRGWEWVGGLVGGWVGEWVTVNLA